MYTPQQIAAAQMAMGPQYGQPIPSGSASAMGPEGLLRVLRDKGIATPATRWEEVCRFKPIKRQ